MSIATWTGIHLDKNGYAYMRFGFIITLLNSFFWYNSTTNMLGSYLCVRETNKQQFLQYRHFL